MRRLLFLLMFMSQAVLPMARHVSVENAVEAAIIRYGLPVEPSLMRAFSHAKVTYPPREVALLAFKKERYIELWARNSGQAWHYIQAYPLKAYSGHLGPKLRERDGQIPEGVYRLTTFNPFSQWHLSMLINYPNAFDRAQASRDGRQHLGSDIFLHGRDRSAGCLAVGDRGIDQLFVLARRVGLSHVKLIIAPNDLRREQPATTMIGQPKWVPALYAKLAKQLQVFAKR